MAVGFAQSEGAKPLQEQKSGGVGGVGVGRETSTTWESDPTGLLILPQGHWGVPDPSP